MSEIIAIFGKRGAGKTTLTKIEMYRVGGRVVFLSPVEKVDYDFISWNNHEIHETMIRLKEGQILHVPRADVEAFDVVALTAMAYGNYTLIIDEMDRYSKAEEINDLIHYSRHCHLNIVCNTRRYTHMPRLLTSQADKLMIFQTSEPRDLQYFKEYADIPNIHIIQDLKEYEYLEYPTNVVKKTFPID